MDLGPKEYYIGEDAQARRGALALSYPLERGYVTNWDSMERLWQHTFDALHVAPEVHPTLLTEAPQTPRPSREKATQQQGCVGWGRG
uniref:Actin n=1 Tax=Arcella intermedia TaxID=1963864 RepID=A0A6B2LWI7_9EUKA